jgi:hypothetical protein
MTGAKRFKARRKKVMRALPRIPTEGKTSPKRHLERILFGPIWAELELDQ